MKQVFQKLTWVLASPARVVCLLFSPGQPFLRNYKRPSHAVITKTKMSHWIQCHCSAVHTVVPSLGSGQRRFAADIARFSRGDVRRSPREATVCGQR